MSAPRPTAAESPRTAALETAIEDRAYWRGQYEINEEHFAAHAETCDFHALDYWDSCSVCARFADYSDNCAAELRAIEAVLS